MKTIHFKAAAWVALKLAVKLIAASVATYGCYFLFRLLEPVDISGRILTWLMIALLLVATLAMVVLALLVLFSIVKSYYLDELQKLKQKEKNEK